MPDGVGLAGWMLMLFVTGLGGTWLARRYALHRKLIDEPGERRSHATATPRGGGISIVVAMLLALPLLATWHPAVRTVLLSGALGMLLVATVGWLDDHRPLSAALRLVVHAVAAALLAMAVLRVNGNALAAGMAFALALVLVNVWNFMDGIDGLAASQAAIASLGYAVISDSQAGAWLSLGLLAATCGFLPFNFPKARIFLGDVGSGSLGFGLAIVLALAFAAKPGLVSPVQFALLLPLSAFMVDASLTLLKRIVRGERWWTAHVGHAYQLWAARLDGHVVVTMAYATWTALGVCLMIAIRAGSTAFIMATVLAWHLLAVVAWFWLQGRSRVPPEGSRA